MTRSSPTFQLAAALVALVFGIGWGAPAVQAACAPSGSSAPGHCCAPLTTQHCSAKDQPASAQCPSHHIGGEAAFAPVPTPNPTVGTDPAIATVSWPQAFTSSFLSSRFSLRRPVLRADRLHARVRVWLE